ncbi:MAG: hypothetical protein HRT88_03355 [Lentisphaeraceae bacterium]|nr:hypothetical protein [Lentisphaeraceae bacterium]
MKRSIAFLLLIFTLTSHARPERMFELMETLRNPDRNKNVKISTTELKKWVDNMCTIFNDTRHMPRAEHMPLVFLKGFDTNKDNKISRKEEKNLEQYLKEIIQLTYKKIVKDYDMSGNGRLESREIKAFNIDHEYNYSKLIFDTIRDSKIVKDEKKKKEKALDDIYD